METIKVIESPQGTYSCEIGISVEEWKKLLSDEKITTPKYKKALLDFYNEPNHQATCIELGQRQNKNAYYYRNMIMHFGEAIIKHLNRFRIQNSSDDKYSYWNVAMNPGTTLPNGKFQWTVRKELTQAIKELGWNDRFAWASFYMELADKLLEFKDNREELIHLVYTLGKHVNYIKADDKGSPVTDIDPFTVIGIFNRGILNETRTDLASTLKEKLSMKSSVPVTFDGIPILNPQKSVFFWRDKMDTDVQPLWDFFEAGIKGNRQQLGRYINIVRKQQGIKWNLTMGLYWIRPYQYISLDTKNQAYLPKIGIQVFNEKQLDATHYFSLLDEVMQKIKSGELKEKSIPEISYNAWIEGKAVSAENDNEDHSNNEIMKYQEYIDLLKANKNLVLTGAPGTGKTFMAKEIAKEMQAEVKFVQFHPSYDYTDFVEGLRPIQYEDGQIGFERKDGIFKEFCKQARKNLEDSKKTVSELSKEQSWQDKLDHFIEDAIETNKEFELTSGSKFTIKGSNEEFIYANNKNNEKTETVQLNRNTILTLLNSNAKLEKVCDIKRFFNQKNNTQGNSYEFVVINEVRGMSNVFKSNSDITIIKRKNFVIIIDEINRGEASKIFGELFYAIDPGYRGENDICVQTQFQNLVPEDDTFAKGFYVPENVYILATMNDIDRSVESMDFAMRRRFTWKEITPDDTAEMLDSLAYSDEAKKRMKSLNDAIASTDGLGRAFMIGPSYFLKLKDYHEDFNMLWSLHIEPLLREYLRGFRNADKSIKLFRRAFDNSQEANE